MTKPTPGLYGGMLTTVLIFAMTTSPGWTETVKPNILLILTDDQGYGDLGLHGNPVLRTPNLDTLGRCSVRFDRFYAQPVCSPTRAALMTGRHFLKTGVWGVHGGRDYMNLDEVTVAQQLKQLGYATAMIGKWHLGKTAAYLPYRRGFDQSWVQTNLYAHRDPILDHNGVIEKSQGWTVSVLTDIALDYLREAAERPFFLYLAYPQIHEPWDVPEPLVQTYIDQGLSPGFATVCAMIEQLDTEVGRLLDELSRRNLNQNTVVIFLGDNGPIGESKGFHPLTNQEMARRNPRGWRGVKGNLFENGCRVPGFFRWSGQWEPKILQTPVEMMDVAPTLLALAGMPGSATPGQMEGVNLLPLLTGAQRTLPLRPAYYTNHEVYWPGKERLYDFLSDRSTLVFERTSLALRLGRYKYIRQWGDHWLIDLEEDPGESHNLASSHPELAKLMSDQLERWWREEIVADPDTYNMPEWQVGLTNEPAVMLHGSAPVAVYGNIQTDALYTSNWIDDGDGQAFAIQVHKAGNYKLKMHVVPGKTRGTVSVEVAEQQLKCPVGQQYSFELGTTSLPEGNHRLRLMLEGVAPDEKPVFEQFRALELIYCSAPESTKGSP